MNIDQYRSQRNLPRHRRALQKAIASVMPFVLSYKLRDMLYKLMGARVAREHVYIGRECHIDDEFPELVSIGRGTCISFRVTIVAHDAYKQIVEPVTIGQYVFIGTGAIILPGVTIGDGAVVAAGAVVNKNVPPKVMVAGVPAKVIKTLS